ncbi:hypothetical protein AVEN_57126-1 [Araneus ventricosus]|uniref:Uncharacterized protein n=1 Tax=Araneus ventricosus TaxID=182803 RepID=A0A4Y2H9H2_ARAVE|nr:hypothetical protein AVEN_57126-1 [Araneus ventricosus]
MESSLSLQKFQQDDTQGWAINCQQRKELLFSLKIHPVARNCLSPVSVEWGGLRRVSAHRVNKTSHGVCAGERGVEAVGKPRLLTSSSVKVCRNTYLKLRRILEGAPSCIKIVS